MDTQKIEQLSIPIHAIHFDYSVLMQTTRFSFQTCLYSIYSIYLLKLYDKSIITLLTNDLTNIRGEISKI